MNTLSDAALAALAATDPADKCRLSRQAAADWHGGRLAGPGHSLPPERPGRPARPQLLAPKEMPKRAYKGDRGRIGLLHALAHIELNAIDLAWDIVCRFPDEDMPKGFYDDWIQVAVDEALHFEMLQNLLINLGSGYGELPAHDGLWQAAEKTADDLAARLVVVPMTLEARGLDTTPATMERLARNGDTMTPPALKVIYDDEIRHVAAGVRWFKHVAAKRGVDGKSEYQRLMAERFPGGLKTPFNHAARAQAGFDQDWYEEMAKAPSRLDGEKPS
ncbi:ferritin-like domain-containing protein [Magnetospirillum sulfuroxidans]|uniref:Ferritin-like domain-containing protein n=1 Tax=Magnetospirillum sulfuroxidans TaxID=611300 RepID=A0ABS5IAY1_9PROT|nr:ferritin-like domain-containing protein [Magnetospirillum sulfuroxidans]MBR9971586.1 ferritin-like domain-containing protein [Magnetospirillum sulfuroxidans]